MKCEKMRLHKLRFQPYLPVLQQRSQCCPQEVGMNYDQPEVDFDEFFTGSSSS